MDMDLYKECRLCPRNCGVDRTNGKIGYCGETSVPSVARAALHYWEEPCISGKNGSGTVFFCGCSLKCVYCQNHCIATGEAKGKPVDSQRLCQIYFELKEKGAHNINLVTATHFTPHVVESVNMAKSKGLDIPIVYNTSGYETVENIKRLAGTVDIYLPDFKYFDADVAKKYSNASDYPKFALKAIEEMLKQVGLPVLEDGIMKKGVIVRHLVLPGHIKASKSAIEAIYNAFGNDVYISIMKQYTPMPHIMSFDDEFKSLKRTLTKGEYKSVVDHAAKLGIVNGFVQYGDNAKESFIPAFDNEGV